MIQMDELDWKARLRDSYTRPSFLVTRHLTGATH